MTAAHSDATHALPLHRVSLLFSFHLPSLALFIMTTVHMAVLFMWSLSTMFVSLCSAKTLMNEV